MFFFLYFNIEIVERDGEIRTKCDNFRYLINPRQILLKFVETLFQFHKI